MPSEWIMSDDSSLMAKDTFKGQWFGLGTKDSGLRFGARIINVFDKNAFNGRLDILHVLSLSIAWSFSLHTTSSIHRAWEYQKILIVQGIFDTNIYPSTNSLEFWTASSRRCHSRLSYPPLKIPNTMASTFLQSCLYIRLPKKAAKTTVNSLNPVQMNPR